MSIPNGNFENWTQGSGYSDPTGWDTPNSTSSTIGVVTVSKESSIVQNGSFAAKLQTKSILGTPIPGLITLGDFNINIITFVATITGGTPFTGKPESMSGYFQYEPVFNDEAFIGIILLKQNCSNWDTIADGSFTSTSTILTWTPFLATLNYRSTDTPTHLNIIIMSSDRNAPQPNSTLYIDNLTLTYPTDINENETGFVTFRQSNNILYLYVNDESNLMKNVQLYSIEGKLIASENYALPINSSEIQTGQFSSGIYMLNIGLENGITLSKKIYLETSF